MRRLQDLDQQRKQEDRQPGPAMKVYEAGKSVFHPNSDCGGCQRRAEVIDEGLRRIRRAVTGGAAVLVLASASIASAAGVSVKIEPIPVSITAKAQAAPSITFLHPGDKVPYPGALIHEDRMAVLAMKAEKHDVLVKDGLPIPPCKLGWKDWTLLVAVALMTGAGGMWSGQKFK